MINAFLSSFIPLPLSVFIRVVIPSALAVFRSTRLRVFPCVPFLASVAPFRSVLIIAFCMYVALAFFFISLFVSALLNLLMSFSMPCWHPSYMSPFIHLSLYLAAPCFRMLFRSRFSLLPALPPVLLPPVSCFIA